MEIKSLGCTLDCFDCCKFSVYYEQDQVLKIEGDKKHPYTKGLICKKGLAHLERTYHPQRLLKPLLKNKDGSYQEISFEQAVERMAQELEKCKPSTKGPSVLYYEQYGSGSVLKSIGEIFFNFFGGANIQKGGPCWSAGMAAQRKNFGDVRSHSLEDLMHSEVIILWGKNPAHTTIHTMQKVNEAQKAGSLVIVIDPIQTKTAKLADHFVQVKPGGDWALALGMAQVMIKDGLLDENFIASHVGGFEAYYEYVNSWDIQVLCQEAGISLENMRWLAHIYATHRSTILLGYGMQKYYNGGNTIMLIDTLGAIAGQIGKPGGGVNYANRVYPDKLNLDPYNSQSVARNKEFYVSELAPYIRENKPQMAVIVKSNLLNQLPDVSSLENALRTIPFKVCFEQFMTDTAKICDLIIPCTTVLESEDLLFSSMTNPYLIYNEKILEPLHPLMDEYSFFQDVARLLKIKDYPYVDKATYLEKVLEPLKTYEPQMSLEYLKTHYFTLHQPVAWKNKDFLTPSGRFEIHFIKELRTSNQTKAYPLRLITNHSKDSLFSQHFMDKVGRAIAYINAKVAGQYALDQGDVVSLSSKQGTIQVVIQIDEGIGNDIVMMYVGWWKKHGNPNYVTKACLSDIGGQVAYNETYVRIEK